MSNERSIKSRRNRTRGKYRSFALGIRDLFRLAARLSERVSDDPDGVLSEIDRLVRIYGKNRPDGLTEAEKEQFWEMVGKYERYKRD